MNEGKTVIKYQFNIAPLPQTAFQKLTQILPKKKDLFRLPQPIFSDESSKTPQDYPKLNVPFTNLSLIP
jgi:hypothetical protein